MYYISYIVHEITTSMANILFLENKVYWIEHCTPSSNNFTTTVFFYKTNFKNPYNNQQQHINQFQRVSRNKPSKPTTTTNFTAYINSILTDIKHH